MTPDRSRKAGGLQAWLAAGLLLLPGTAAAQDPAAGLAERADGAERVVVGRVTSVNGVWQNNEFGDRLIVSVVRVAVEETLKGQAQPTMELEVEGGTIGDLTLHVSDITPVAPGDRAVFYVRRNPRGVLVPHRRGLGLLKLDRSQRVAGSNLSLDEIRRAVRSRGGR